MVRTKRSVDDILAELHERNPLPPGDPERPESENEAKKEEEDDAVNGMNMLLLDCREAMEPVSYIFKVDTAPRRLLKRLYANQKMGKCNYEFVFFDEEADATDDLIDEEDEYEDGDIYEDVSAWLDSMCKSDGSTKFRAPFDGKIDFTVSLISALKNSTQRA